VGLRLVAIVAILLQRTGRPKGGWARMQLYLMQLYLMTGNCGHRNFSDPDEFFTRRCRRSAPFGVAESARSDPPRDAADTAVAWCSVRVN